MPEENESIDTGSESLNLDVQLGTEQTVNDSINPAWNEVLGVIPKEFHNQITPHFKAWDQNVQQLTEKTRNEAIKPYEGFKQFVDNRVNPNDLVAAYQVFTRLNQQPLDLYNRLGEMLRQQGLLQPEQQQQIPGSEEDEQQQFQDPRVDAVLKQQQQLAEWFQTQQQTQQQQQAFQQFAQQINTQVDDEFNQLSKAIGGPVPEWLRVELIRRATWMTDQGNPAGILDAFKDWQQLQSQAAQVRNAPKIVPSGGGFPAQQPNADALKTPDGRAEAVREIINRFNQ